MNLPPHYFSKRPEFVKKEDLEDRAYGFEGGDLRGLYAVLVSTPPPDTSEVEVPDAEDGRGKPDLSQHLPQLSFLSPWR